MTPKKRFILDENVLIRAQTGLNASDEPDATCTKLVDQIIGICHTIVIDIALWNKIASQLNRESFRQGPLGGNMLRVLAAAIRIERKFDDWTRNAAPPFEGEEEIPQGSQDDVPVSVRLAVDTQAILVTGDNPLREHLRSANLQVLSDLAVLTPEEALKQM